MFIKKRLKEEEHFSLKRNNISIRDNTKRERR
jgi:hypothetical protein